MFISDVGLRVYKKPRYSARRGGGDRRAVVGWLIPRTAVACYEYRCYPTPLVDTRSREMTKALCTLGGATLGLTFNRTRRRYENVYYIWPATINLCPPRAKQTKPMRYLPLYLILSAVRPSRAHNPVYSGFPPFVFIILYSFM